MNEVIVTQHAVQLVASKLDDTNKGFKQIKMKNFLNVRMLRAAGCPLFMAAGCGAGMCQPSSSLRLGQMQ
jgi:hypothetical protein